MKIRLFVILLMLLPLVAKGQPDEFDYSELHDYLYDITIIDPDDGYFIVGDGSDWIREAGNTARTSLGLGTIATFAGNQDLQQADSPTFAGLTIGGGIPILIFKDTTDTGDSTRGYQEWRGSNNVRLGFFGNHSYTNDDLKWKNESSGGHLLLETTGTGIVSSNTDFTTTGDVSADNLTGTFIAATHTPASATDTGTAGTITWDSSYLYVCITTNTWKRVALGTWAVTDVLLLSDGSSKLLLSDGSSFLLIRQ